MTDAEPPEHELAHGMTGLKQFAKHCEALPARLGVADQLETYLRGGIGGSAEVELSATIPLGIGWIAGLLQVAIVNQDVPSDCGLAYSEAPRRAVAANSRGFIVASTRVRHPMMVYLPSDHSAVDVSEGLENFSHYDDREVQDGTMA